MTALPWREPADFDPLATVHARLYGNVLGGVLAAHEDVDARDAAVSNAQFLRELRRGLRAAHGATERATGGGRA